MQQQIAHDVSAFWQDQVHESEAGRAYKGQDSAIGAAFRMLSLCSG